MYGDGGRRVRRMGRSITLCARNTCLREVAVELVWGCVLFWFISLRFRCLVAFSDVVSLVCFCQKVPFSLHSGFFDSLKNLQKPTHTSTQFKVLAEFPVTSWPSAS